MITDLAAIIKNLQESTALDLDQLVSDLQTLSRQADELIRTAKLYELELQREVRAKVDLCGGISGCPKPEFAFDLTGQALLAARREATRRFNETFFMAPLCRKAQKSSS